jgi:uncharacterized membrane protein YcaP (DUF421 family)
VFFESWIGLYRILVVGVIAYLILIALLRISGKRTLSKMNAFDLVITVALGSTFSTVLLNRDIPLAEGVLALGLLVFLQYAITWASVRFKFVRSLVKSEPTAVVKDGTFIFHTMREQRVTQAEIEAAVREHGYPDIASIASVVMETDGSLSVIPS